MPKIDGNLLIGGPKLRANIGKTMDTIQTYKKTILEHHLDTFGHVNNATYFELYEEARWEFMTQGGYDLKTVQDSKLGPVILEMSIRFKKELRNRETITITMESVRVQGKILELYQEMIKEDGSIASTLNVVLGFFDLRKRKLITPTAEWLKAIRAQ